MIRKLHLVTSLAAIAFGIITFIFCASVAFAGLTTVQYVIVDDAVGGDCALIGSWDPADKTCTMERDLIQTGDSFEVVVISSPGVTLDGNGHMIKGSVENNTYAVFSQAQYVTIKNLVIIDYYCAIKIISHNTVENNFLVSNSVAIQASGMFDYGSVVTGNTFAANGINIMGAKDNPFNVPKFSGRYTATDNNFFGGGLGNSFHGMFTSNYYAEFDEAGEGCVDGDADGYCDAPMAYYNDPQPRMAALALDQPISCGAPEDLTLEVTGVEWMYPSSYYMQVRNLNVGFRIKGSDDTYWGIQLVGFNNTNGVMLNSTLYPNFSFAGHDGGRANSAGFTTTFNVPPGMNSSFRTTMYAVTIDACGNTRAYPGPMPLT